jgi:hypothetical protein
MPSTTDKPRNCSAECAEMNGGHCPGASCVYRPDVYRPDRVEQKAVRISALLAMIPPCRDGNGCECPACEAYGESLSLLAMLRRERVAS